MCVCVQPCTNIHFWFARAAESTRKPERERDRERERGIQRQRHRQRQKQRDRGSKKTPEAKTRDCNTIVTQRNTQVMVQYII